MGMRVLVGGGFGAAHDFAKTGVCGRGLAASRRAGDQQRAGSLVEQAVQRAINAGGQAEFGDSSGASGGCDQPHHGPFAMQGGKSADTPIGALAGPPHPAFLRNINAVGQKFRQHLEPRDNVRGGAGGKLADRLQDAIESPRDGESIWRGLQVDVAGSRLLDRRQQSLDEVARVARVAWIQLSQVVCQHRGAIWRRHWSSVAIPRTRKWGKTRLDGFAELPYSPRSDEFTAVSASSGPLGVLLR